jgi:hypothetical protein
MSEVIAMPFHVCHVGLPSDCPAISRNSSVAPRPLETARLVHVFPATSFLIVRCYAADSSTFR